VPATGAEREEIVEGGGKPEKRRQETRRQRRGVSRGLPSAQLLSSLGKHYSLTRRCYVITSPRRRGFRSAKQVSDEQGVTMAEVKGVLLNAVLSFLGERFGEEALDKAIANLSPSDRVLLPTVILASNWYAYSAWGPVRRLTAALSQGKDPDLGIEMGKFNASYVFGGVYKSLLIKDPAKLVKKFSWMHDFFYRDGLSLETELP